MCCGRGAFGWHSCDRGALCRFNPRLKSDCTLAKVVYPCAAAIVAVVVAYRTFKLST